MKVTYQKIPIFDDKKYELYTMGSTKVESHLTFADDVMFFGRASTWKFLILKCILNEFSSFSSLEINHDKSFIVYSAKVGNNEVLASILSFQIRQLLI